jgi:periplasmic copper chaperone A
MKEVVLFFLSLTWLQYAYAGPYDPIVSMAWVGETIPEQKTVTLQLNLTTIKQVKLLSVSSPLVEGIEIHRLTNQKGALKISKVNSLLLPEHRTTAFGSRKLFLMMVGIKQPFKIGDQIPLKLEFAFNDKRNKTLMAVATVKKVELSYKHYGPNEVYDHR